LGKVLPSLTQIYRKHHREVVRFLLLDIQTIYILYAIVYANYLHLYLIRGSMQAVDYASWFDSILSAVTITIPKDVQAIFHIGEYTNHTSIEG